MMLIPLHTLRVASSRMKTNDALRNAWRLPIEVTLLSTTAEFSSNDWAKLRNPSLRNVTSIQLFESGTSWYEAGCKPQHPNVWQYLPVCMHFASIWMLRHEVTEWLGRMQVCSVSFVSCQVHGAWCPKRVLAAAGTHSCESYDILDSEQWKQFQRS
jgi:hypothetical protein